MIEAVRQFFRQLAPEQQQQTDPQSIKVATAALLFEIMRADDEFDCAEQSKIRSLLKKQFTLSDSQVEQMLVEAEKEAHTATDYHQFTRLLNEQYDTRQRMEIVELLWQVALADGVLDSHEEHLIRRMADLLRLRHSEYIQCKLKVMG